jgi:hypothetical protein
MNKFLLFLLLIANSNIYSQLAANFTVTDTDGNTHRLFEDYLDKGKVVVMKLFFVNCPPCNSIAKSMQQKYVNWGAGNNNVQFIELTTKIGDKNPFVIQYKNMHGITFPSISSEGGSLNAIIPYTNGTYGPYTGTPTLIVIAPNKTLMYDVLFNNLDAVIEMMGGQTSAPPNQISINLTLPTSNFPDDVSLLLKSKTDVSKSYNVTALTNGTHSFTYPSDNFPEIGEPYFELQSNAPSQNGLVSVTDLVAIRNHILGSNPLAEEWQRIAADVNSDGKITVTDMVGIQKSILYINTHFPNNTPSYKMIPADIPFSVPQTGGTNVNLAARIIKMGNVK